MSTPAAASTRSVGPYRLIGQIGEGGMGLVYLAQAPDDRRVAVKILRPAVVGDANGRARLAREVTSLRRVRSPRIAEVYDADPWGATPYIVMRYVAGPSLREVVDHRGPLTGSALLRLARGLSEALVVVHRADVLHRDVKPSNVLIEDGEPVLIDFGLAQLSDDMTLTQVGWLMGTPGYLAPEILYGDGPTQAADIHSWAATVTFAATGHGPYGTGPAAAVMDRARRGEFVLDDAPAPLVDVLAAALRPDPLNRPTAQQLVDWLDLLIERGRAVPEEAVPASVDSARERRTNVVALQSRTAALPAIGPYPPLATGPAVERRDPRERWWFAAFWTSILLVVLAAVLVVPVVGVFWVLLAGWALRTATFGVRRLRTWRIARGPRRRDPVQSGFAVPWWTFRTAGGTLLNGCFLAFATAGFIALARFGPQSVQTPSLVVAGVLAAFVGWHGPATRDVREGGWLLTSQLPRSGLARATIVVLLLAVASGLLAAFQITGTSYAPFG